MNDGPTININHKDGKRKVEKQFMSQSATSSFTVRACVAASGTGTYLLTLTDDENSRGIHLAKGITTKWMLFHHLAG